MVLSSDRSYNYPNIKLLVFMKHAALWAEILLFCSSAMNIDFRGLVLLTCHVSGLHLWWRTLSILAKLCIITGPTLRASACVKCTVRQCFTRSGAVRMGMRPTRGRLKCRQEVFYIFVWIFLQTDTHISLDVLRSPHRFAWWQRTRRSLPARCGISHSLSLAWLLLSSSLHWNYNPNSKNVGMLCKM